MKDGRPTVYDIARLAGVSPSTVSRVITGVAKVRPDKEQRIREVMRDLDFMPNAFARTLLRKRSQTLGVIIPDITNLFFSQTFLALERAAFTRGYSLLLGNTLNSDHNPDVDLESFYLASLLERQVDGLILMGGRVNDSEMEPRKREELLRLDRLKPLVTINGAIHGSGIPGIRSVEEGGIERLVAHLWALGHRDFALVGGVPGITAFDLKRKALDAALRQRGGFLSPERIYPSGFSIREGAEAAARLFSSPARPTALVCINDFVAMGALRQAADAGCRVPGQFSITGFDDIQTSAFLVPSLSTVSHRYEELAASAVETLLTRIEGGEPPQETLVECEAIFRESTGPIPR